MIARIRKSLDEKDQGFTLIELLVVMIIIGILAAIAIPVFLNQQKKAAETAAKSDASTISKEIVAYYVDGTGDVAVTSATGTWTLAGGTPSATITTGKLSDGNAATAAGTDATSWCVTVDPTGKVSGAKKWSNSSIDGLKQGACGTDNKITAG